MYLGIEIGGTKLQLGVGTAQTDALRELIRSDIDAAQGASRIREQIVEASEQLLPRYNVTRIGVGFGGPVDCRTGTIATSHQVPGWDDFRLAEWLTDQFKIPAIVRNDCDAAALAESRLGAGANHKSILYVTIGTGIGGGLVVDGELYGGDRPSVVEIGHLRPGLMAARSDVTVESLASGWGISNVMRELLRCALGNSSMDGGSAEWRESVAHVASLVGFDPHDSANRRDGREIIDQLDSTDEIDARQVANWALAGNHVAMATLRTASMTLGWAIAQAVNLLAPELIVMGGGVSQIDDSIFFIPMRSAIDQFCFPPLRNSYELVHAGLGEQVVVHGALLLAAGR